MKDCTGRMCKKCPFKKGAIAGWLGPWSGPVELHQFVVGERPFPCHMTMGGDDETVHERDMTLCTGSMLYASGVAKKFREPWLAEMQRKAARGPDVENVMGYKEFMDRHAKLVQPKCDLCGKFMNMEEANCDFTPDSDLSTESIVWMCEDCWNN